MKEIRPSFEVRIRVERTDVNRLEATRMHPKVCDQAARRA